MLIAMETILNKVRLSYFYWIFAAIFTSLILVLPRLKFETAASTLFSVNSFLYGFYISPILGNQRSRVDELHKIVRAEANALFSMMILTKKMSTKTRNNLQAMVMQYVDACLVDKSKGHGEAQYEELIGKCLSYAGDDQEKVNKFLDQLVSNQTNRSNLFMQLSAKVYSNEWWIMSVLFSITLAFILLIDVGKNWWVHIIQVLLSTGLSMLIINLLKLSTLSHKKAKGMWIPLEKLKATNFFSID
jgi:hypothetical protein